MIFFQWITTPLSLKITNHLLRILPVRQEEDEEYNSSAPKLVMDTPERLVDLAAQTENLTAQIETRARTQSLSARTQSLSAPLYRGATEVFSLRTRTDRKGLS